MSLWVKKNNKKPTLNTHPVTVHQLNNTIHVSTGSYRRNLHVWNIAIIFLLDKHFVHVRTVCVHILCVQYMYYDKQWGNGIIGWLLNITIYGSGGSGACTQPVSVRGYRAAGGAMHPHWQTIIGCTQIDTRKQWHTWIHTSASAKHNNFGQFYVCVCK